MSSHGVPRTRTREERGTEARQKELQEIAQYKEVVEDVNLKVDQKEFTPQLLQKTAELLKKNPEYYTIWNHRRRIYTNEFNALQTAVDSGGLEDDSRVSQVLDIIQLDLQFLFPLLLKFPKCYWIWNHRIWLLEQATLLLPVARARALWQDELGLVGKMLSRDSRNFHGWGYRRMVVQSLESEALSGTSMTQQELDYSKKMIGINLSNFSAWHNRSKLILKILDEKRASDEERQKMLDEELELIHKALFDPYDQSLWFYHQNLMCTFDPKLAARSMAPNLSEAERLSYIASEQQFIEEVLEDAPDCKWPFQALIESTLIESKLKRGLSSEDRAKILGWLKELKGLDPLRRGRWNDLEASLVTSL